MSDPARLLAELSELGIEIQALPNRNLFLTPLNRLKPELIERIKACKPALVEILRSRSSGAATQNPHQVVNNSAVPAAGPREQLELGVPAYPSWESIESDLLAECGCGCIEAVPPPRDDLIEQPNDDDLGWRDDPDIPLSLRDELLRWESELRVLGWSDERIWRRKYWPHSREHPRGLSSILHPSDRIVFADHDYVSVQDRNGSTVRIPREG
jgi:hypothetical protein